jgi:hypothetical protein
MSPLEEVLGGNSGIGYIALNREDVVTVYFGY